LKILLYKTGTDTAFRKFDNPCQLVIPKDEHIVTILDVTEIDGKGEHPALGKYRLVKRHDPIWTDDTKNNMELLVRLTVEELE
jgi:hypothetical protein